MDRVVSKGDCFQSFGGLLPQVGWCKSFTGTVMGAYPLVRGSRTTEQCIRVSLGVPRGRGGRGEPMFRTCGSWSVRPTVSEAAGQGIEGLRSCKVRMLCSWASNVEPIYHHPCLQLRSN